MCERERGQLCGMCDRNTALAVTPVARLSSSHATRSRRRRSGGKNDLLGGTGGRGTWAVGSALVFGMLAKLLLHPLTRLLVEAEL